MSTSGPEPRVISRPDDPDGVFGPQIRVERHLRKWGHLPDRECGDTGPDGRSCEMPGAEPVNDEGSRLEFESSPIAENRREQYRNKYLGTRPARRERFKTAEKTGPSKSEIRKRRKRERQNRRKR